VGSEVYSASPASTTPLRNAPPSRLSLTAGIFLVVTGALVLLGWRFDLHVLKGLSGPITMKANAAVGLLAAGTSLLLCSLPACFPRARMQGPWRLLRPTPRRG